MNDEKTLEFRDLPDDIIEKIIYHMQENSINFSQVSKTMNRLTKRTIETLNFYENEEKDYSFKIYNFTEKLYDVLLTNQIIDNVNRSFKLNNSSSQIFINDGELIFKYFSDDKEMIFKEKLRDNFKLFHFNFMIFSAKFLFGITVINIYNHDKLITVKLPGKLKYIYDTNGYAFFISNVSIIRYEKHSKLNSIDHLRIHESKKISIKYQDKTYILYAYKFGSQYYNFFIDCGDHYRKIEQIDRYSTKIYENNLTEKMREEIVRQYNHVVGRKYKNYFEYKIK